MCDTFRPPPIQKKYKAQNLDVTQESNTFAIDKAFREELLKELGWTDQQIEEDREA